MAKIKLTKKNYLGRGYVHAFKNDTTGDIKWVPCTKNEYERMGEKDGSKYNPVLEGYSWQCSYGGSVMVDNPDTVLGEDEYVEVDNEVIIKLKDQEEDNKIQFLPKEKVDKDGFLDEVDIKQK